MVPILTYRFIANLRDAGLQESTTIGEHNPASIMHFTPPSAGLLNSVAEPLELVGDELTDDELTDDDSGARWVISIKQDES